MVAFLRRLAGGTTTRAPDRRLSARFACQAPSACRPAEGRGTEAMAIVRDLSSGGVRVLVGRRFQRGELLTLDLPCAGAAARKPMLACVRHAAPDADGRWLVGCSFIRELSEGELGACLMKGTSPSLACGRRTFAGGPSAPRAAVAPTVAARTWHPGLSTDAGSREVAVAAGPSLYGPAPKLPQGSYAH